MNLFLVFGVEVPNGDGLSQLRLALMIRLLTARFHLSEDVEVLDGETSLIQMRLDELLEILQVAMEVVLVNVPFYTVLDLIVHVLELMVHIDCLAS